jgi:arylsulfatase A-like enzyme
LKGLTDVEFPRAQYRAEIDYIDSELARVLELGRFREGVTAFTADHGESFGAHGVWWDHAELYPDSLHVPLVLAWPGAPGGERRGEAVQLADLGRTLLDLAGIEAPGFPGRDLREAQQGAPGPRYALARDGHSASIQAGGWHLILHLADHHPAALVEPRERHRVELYDLRRDPRAEHDRIDAEPGRARELRRALIEWLAAAPAEGLAAPSAASLEQRARLAGLGYAEGAEAVGAAGDWFDERCGCAWCLRFR